MLIICLIQSSVFNKGASSIEYSFYYIYKALRKIKGKKVVDKVLLEEKLKKIYR